MSNFVVKQRKLVDSLIKKTNESDLKWELGLGGKSVFTNFPSGKVELKWDLDENGQDAVRVTLFDESGNDNLSFDDTALAYRNEFTEKIESYYSRMEELLNSAFIMARGEDALLDRFLSDLSESDW